MDQFTDEKMKLEVLAKKNAAMAYYFFRKYLEDGKQGAGFLTMVAATLIEIGIEKDMVALHNAAAEEMKDIDTKDLGKMLNTMQAVLAPNAKPTQTLDSKQRL